jgi:hypothetical protein
MTNPDNTPSSPLELVSMQKGASEGDSNKATFFDKVGILVYEETPCLCQMQAVAERLVAMMHEAHEQTVENEADELPEWALATWKKDRKRLKKALALIRDVH